MIMIMIFTDPLSDWTHVVLNYIGPEDPQGIEIYYDGVHSRRAAIGSAASSLPGDGRIVIGRRYTDGDYDYASVQLDELMFFNTALMDSEISMLSQI